MGFLSNLLFRQAIESKYQEFHTLDYLDITARRLEHLATLGLEIQSKHVLELGAGVGDLTQFFVSRDCKITATDARSDLVEIIRSRFPNEVSARVLDLENTNLEFKEVFDIVFCYGVLYHLSDPEAVIKTLARSTQNLLLLETCVTEKSVIGADQRSLISEDSKSLTQAFHGTGCRPNRNWLYETLKQNFEYVYTTKTQPRHKQFPLDWRQVNDEDGLHRAIFICSKKEMFNPNLSPILLNKHDAQM
jgi:SAM-dependent methyltransferase